MNDFTHLDKQGNASMVDISGKSVTTRTATAQAVVRFPATVYQQIKDNHSQTAKGAIMDIAQIAGIMAAKKTSDLIPLCHPLPLNKAGVECSYDDAQHAIVVTATTRTDHKTGVEMEALVAATTAALTIYDMCKALSHDITIEQVCVLEKTGGKSDYKVNLKK